MMAFRWAALCWLPLIGLGCSSDNTPCSSQCPPLEGTYHLDLPDAGVDADCAAMGVTVESGDLAITQEGPELFGQFAGTAFNGLAYDTQAFSLNAGPQSDGGTTGTRTLRGQVGAGPHDGGVARWTGTYLISLRETPRLGPPRTCSLQRSFTATRR